MFGKHFASMYTGSMVGSGACVFAVWGYVIAHAIDSRVELNPRLLAAIIGEPESTIRAAVAKLEEPDEESRSKISDGRRLIREGQFQFYVPTWENYRRIRQEEERREYNREKKREERAKKSSMTVNDSQHGHQMSAMSAKSEAEADTENTYLVPKIGTEGSQSGNASARLPESDRFSGLLKFWKSYPPIGRSRSSWRQCLEKWKKGKCETISGLIVNSLEKWKRSDKWTRDHGQYVENAHGWIKNQKWTECPPVAVDDEDPDNNGFVRAPVTKEMIRIAMGDDAAERFAAESGL